MKLKLRMPSMPARKPQPSKSGGLRRLPLPHIRRLERRTLTATVDGSLIRIVGFGGGQPVAWQTIDLNGAGPYELSPAFAGFGPLRSRHLADLPFYATMIRYIPRPAVSRRYMAEVVSREVGATLPFERDEIEFHWTPFRDGRGPEVAATALPTWEVDSQIALLAKTGVRPSATYTKAIALTTAAGFDDAMLVHVAPGTTSLVLVRGGIPRAVHQVELPHPRGDIGQRVDVIERGVQALEAFDEFPSDDPLPVIATGSLSDAPELDQALASRFGTRFTKPVRSLQAPADFPATEYAANVGLMLTDRAQRRRMAFRRPAIETIGPDLLPMRHRRRRLPIEGMAALAVVFALAGAAYSLTEPVQARAGEVEALGARVETREREARVERIQAGRETKLIENITSAQGLSAALADLAVKTEIDAGEFNERISILTTDVPVESILLNAVSLNNGAYQVSGAGGSFTDVLAFATALRASPLFDSAELGPLSNQGYEEQDDGDEAIPRPVTFTLTGTYGGPEEPPAGDGESPT